MERKMEAIERYEVIVSYSNNFFEQTYLSAHMVYIDIPSLFISDWSTDGTIRPRKPKLVLEWDYNTGNLKWKYVLPWNSV